MLSIYKTGYFEAAHKLEGHPKCGKLHGHSYKYEVFITSPYNKVLNEEWFFVMDYHDIKEYFNKFDHSDVIITISAEKISMNAQKELQKLVPKSVSVKVRIWETVTSYAEYYD